MEIIQDVSKFVKTTPSLLTFLKKSSAYDTEKLVESDLWTMTSSLVCRLNKLGLVHNNIIYAETHDTL